MKKILEFLTGDLFKGIGGIVDDVVTTKEEAAVLKNKLLELILSYSLDSDRLRAGIIEVEAKGNWLQRSWRPIVMLTWAFIVTFHYAIYPVFKAFNSELPDLPLLDSKFWVLLEIGVGGYVVGRSVEKIVPNLKINTK